MHAVGSLIFKTIKDASPTKHFNKYLIDKHFGTILNQSTATPNSNEIIFINLHQIVKKCWLQDFTFLHLKVFVITFFVY